jgi:hypothetical protein
VGGRGGSSSAFQGYIDDVRMYTNILSAADIKLAAASTVLQNTQYVTAAVYYGGQTVLSAITFSPPFASTPTISAVLNQGTEYRLSVSISAVSSTGVTFAINNPSASSSSSVAISVQWTARG